MIFFGCKLLRYVSRAVPLAFLFGRAAAFFAAAARSTRPCDRTAKQRERERKLRMDPASRDSLHLPHRKKQTRGVHFNSLSFNRTFVLGVRSTRKPPVVAAEAHAHERFFPVFALPPKAICSSQIHLQEKKAREKVSHEKRKRREE